VAKKKEKVEAEEKNPLQAKFLKDYGDIWMTAKDVEDDILNFVPISPALDLQTGGVREGSLVLISGKPKSAKTTLSLECMKQAHDIYNKPLFFIDIENRFSGLHLNSVKGLPLDKITVIKSTKDKILSAEDYLEITRDIIKTIPGAFIIFDSTSALTSSDELSSKITAQYRNQNPRLLANFFRVIMPIISINKTVLIVLQHMIANQNATSPYAPKTYEDGGNKIIHAANLKLRNKAVSKWVDPSGTIIGQISQWEILFSSIGNTFSKTDTYIKYGVGICKEAELIKIGIDVGVINKAGAWLTYDDNRVQGEFKLIQTLEENPELYTKLQKDVKKVYN